MNERKSFKTQRNIDDNKNMNCSNEKNFYQQYSNKKLEKICITNVNNLNNKAGITLIALVISIIVMLILAGVSLNATIGDNGIITQAQNATYMQSVAVLEEFFNNYYIENYENVKSSESKIEELTTFKPEWFYIPASEGIGGLRYIPDSDGNALYLIKKSNLPNEIKNQIKGGDAGNGSYTDYASLNDVYGITNDLKIYYCKNGKDSIIGIEKSNLDNDNPNRIVLDNNSELSKILGEYDKNNDGNFDAQEIKAIKELTINSSDSITSLKDLYNLTSLQKLILDTKELENLAGIENAVQLNYVEFRNSNIKDYSNLSKVSNLKYLYMYNPTDIEVKKLCNGLSNSQQKNIEYFGLFGYNLINYAHDIKFFSQEVKSSLTDISELENLPTTIKESIKYLYLNNNKLNSIIALKDFKNIYLVNLTMDKDLSSLSGLENKLSLKYVYAGNTGITSTEGLKGCNYLYDFVANNTKLQKINNLTGNELSYIHADSTEITTLDGLENQKIVYLSLKNSKNLQNVKAIKDIKTIQELYLTGCENMVVSDVATLENVIIQCGLNYSLPSKYSICFANTPRIDYSEQNLTDNSIEINALKNKKSCTALSLKNCKKLTNTKLQEILSTMTEMQYLQLYGIENLSSIDFVKNMKNLKEIDIRGTSVSDLTNLENNEKMLQLCIDNSNCNLDKIPKTITRCKGTSDGWSYYQNWANNKYSYGLCLTGNTELLAKLGNVLSRDFQSLYMYYDTNFQNGELNLTKCPNLKYIYIDNLPNVSISLPNSIETIRLVHMDSSKNTLNTFGSLENLTTLYVTTAPEMILKRSLQLVNGAPKLTKCDFGDSLMNEFPKNVNLPVCKEMYFFCSNTSSNQNVTSLKNLDSANLPNLEMLRLEYNRNLTALKGIENLENLKNLNCYNCGLTDISDISGCTKLESLELSNNTNTSKYNSITDISRLKNLTNLIYLGLKSNKISDLKGIENCTKLKTLNLENNCIYDTSATYDSNNNIITYNNLEILANLNKTGSLRELYLAGNKGIAIWTPVSSITNWSNKSGW